MTPGDTKTGQELLREDFIQANGAWAKELELMCSMGVKAEIQALSSFDFREGGGEGGEEKGGGDQ